MPKTRGRPLIYLDLDGQEIDLQSLDKDERALVEELLDSAKRQPEWNEFFNFWFNRVAAFYDARGVPRKESRHLAAYKIGSDLEARLGIAQGRVRKADWRDQLESLIREKYASRREFCEATGISEDMLSHVLAGRKDFSLQALSESLAKVGYQLQIVPAKPVQSAA